MERPGELSIPAYVEAMRAEFERVMRGVAEAVNQAPAGQVIDASEERVRDLLGEFRAKAYQTALQMRVNAAEAAFSPCRQPDAPTQAGQRPQRPSPSDRQRRRDDLPATLLQPRGRYYHAERCVAGRGGSHGQPGGAGDGLSSECGGQQFRQGGRELAADGASPDES